MSGLELVCPSGPSDTGAFRISWSGSEGRDVRLEENETLLYAGPDEATTVSGRPEGEYSYRIGYGDSGEVWADSCRVAVSPPPLSLAFSLFGVGLIVFLSLLVVVVRGHRRSSDLSTSADA